MNTPHNWLEVANWQDALSSDWEITGDEGHWELQDGLLRICVDEEGLAPGLELRHPLGTDLDGDFALEMDLRFLSVGRMDNDTHEGARLTIELGTRGTAEQGMQIVILADRYMVDVDRSPLQFMIFRSADARWHHWRLEVRAHQGTVALVRDGEYICSHQLHGPRERGFRMQARGTPEVPTIVEVGALTIVPLAPAPTEAPPRPVPADLLQPGEWPMFRRDRRNSAHSPLVGTLGKSPPDVAWSYPLGGSCSDVYVADCNADGKDEILIAFPGSLAAYRADGTALWKRHCDSPVMFEVCDLDDDGRAELVIVAGSPRRIEILDGATGETRYVCEYDPEYDVRGLRTAKLDPQLPGLQMVVWSNREIGYCLGFDGGAESGRVIWTYNYEHFNFTPEVAMADMDGDGLLDVVLATYSHFFVYDGRSGAVKMSLEAPLGRNYGLLTVKDVDGDGYPDIIMLAESLREHVAVVRNEAGQSLRLLWDKFYEQNYPLDLKQLRTLPGSVADWDGDGRVEILYGLYDETEADMWRTLVVDALTGEIKVSLDNYYPLTLDYLASGMPVAFLSEIHGRGERREVVGGAMSHTEQGTDGPMRLFTFAGGVPRTLAELPPGMLLLDHSWRMFPESEWSIFWDLRTPLRRSGEPGIYLVESPGDAKVIRYLELDPSGARQGSWTCSLASDLPCGQVLQVLDGKSLTLASNDSRRCIMYAGSDSVIYLLDENGRPITTFPGGGLVSQPIVADTQGTPRLNVLVHDARDRLLCLAAQEDDTAPTLQWHLPSPCLHNSVRRDQGEGVPIALDTNQDGSKEVVAGQLPRKVSVIDGKGRVEWSCELPDLPSFWTYGNFTGRDSFDLFVAHASAAYGGGCGVYIPCPEASPVWRSGCGAYAPAVWDLDGDGRDDVIMRDLFWRRMLDGVTGRDVFPVTQWCGYHTPTVVQDPACGRVILAWTGGNYFMVVETLEGQLLWRMPFMAHWHPAAIADVDGDGHLEMGAVTWGQVFTWPPPMEPLPGLGRAFACLDLETGEVKWTYDPGTSMSAVVSADVDGDGRAEFLFGTGDGRLVALHGGPEGGDSRVVFSVQLPAALGMPIVCDPLGKGELHILVGCADGNLYALK